MRALVVNASIALSGPDEFLRLFRLACEADSQQSLCCLDTFMRVRRRSLHLNAGL
jgi:hypothetical protein